MLSSMQTSQEANSLNLDAYPGIYPSDLVPNFMKTLATIFMALPDESPQKEAITRYIELLGNYCNVSDKDSPLIRYALHFCDDLKSFIQNNVDFKYPEYDVEITVKGRIKSPISASDKIKTEITQYQQEGKDLETLVIKDLFAFRIIVTVKDKNGTILGDDIAIPITYDVVEQAIEYAKAYENVQVNKSKARSDKEAPIVFSNITLPTQRTPYIEEHEALGDFKDYIKYPKRDSNYQSVHSKLQITLPTRDFPLLIEMQIRTYEMNEHAEHGPASHSVYKSRKIISFSRVPQVFEESENGTLEFLPMDEAFKEFYSISISDLYPDLTLNMLEDLFKHSDDNSLELDEK